MVVYITSTVLPINNKTSSTVKLKILVFDFTSFILENAKFRIHTRTKLSPILHATSLSLMSFFTGMSFL